MATSEIRLELLDSIPLAVVKRQVKAAELSRAVPEGCGLVFAALREQQARAGRNVALYWDGSIRLDVGVELLGPFVESGEVVHSATPAGLVAWATHLGPYRGLGRAHEAIQQWCRAGNRNLAGPQWEIYGHWLPEWNENPQQIRTDVCYLLAE